nr:M15 family metallopeptidase [bacterium]
MTPGMQRDYGPYRNQEDSKPNHKRQAMLQGLLVIAVAFTVFAMGMLLGRASARLVFGGQPAPTIRPTPDGQTPPVVMITPAPFAGNARPTPVSPVASAPLYGSAAEDWMLTLVNAAHPMQPGYQPELAPVGGGHALDVRVVDALHAMLEAARRDGVEPVVCSSYRTQEKQQQLFERKVAQQQQKGLRYDAAVAAAKSIVAYPGTSEPQLGLAVDIVSSAYQVLDGKQAQTPEAMWLKENCARFGFVLRYPPDKSAVTGIVFEPWHFRYVGVRAAQDMMANGLCLEEYLQAIGR